MVLKQVDRFVKAALVVFVGLCAMVSNIKAEGVETSNVKTIHKVKEAQAGKRHVPKKPKSGFQKQQTDSRKSDVRPGGVPKPNVTKNRDFARGMLRKVSSNAWSQRSKKGLPKKADRLSGIPGIGKQDCRKTSDWQLGYGI